jgi:hypothetical protein
MATLRKDLIASGVIVPQGDALVFAQDYVFGSPSTSAGVIMGRTANGRDTWKTEDGRTLKQVQAAT